MKAPLVGLWLLAVGLGVCATLAADTYRYSGRLMRFTSVVRDDTLQINVGETWVNVKGTWVEFTTTREGPAVATVCGEMLAGTDVYLQLRVAGVAKWYPRSVYAEAYHGDLDPRSHCANFFTTLPAGTHRIRVQWHCTTGNCFINERSLKVEHEN